MTTGPSIFKIIGDLAKYVALCAVFFQITEARGQENTAIGEEDNYFPHTIEGKTVMAKVIDGDTIILVDLKPAEIIGDRYYHINGKTLSYAKLKYYVRKIYPYARLAAEKLEKYDEKLASLEKNRHKRKAMKSEEKSIKDDFTDDIKNMTRIQGALLIKLINRETGLTSYDILKDKRNGFTALMWQGVAKIYGEDLKDVYDPLGQDKMVEEIVQMIERGELTAFRIKPNDK